MSRPLLQPPGAPAPPPAAADVFVDRLPLARRYAELLCTAGVERGLIGPREAERIWTRHLLNSTGLARWVPDGARVADLGSGAGLPGIPLLLARPDLRLTLVEPMLRRVTFLQEVIASLGLSAELVRGRAEQLPEASFDVVVARALAPLSRLVQLAVPLLLPGGSVLALKGAAAGTEIADATCTLSAMKVVAELHEVESGGDVTRVVRVTFAGTPTSPCGVVTAPGRRRQDGPGRRTSTGKGEG